MDMYVIAKAKLVECVSLPGRSRVCERVTPAGPSRPASLEGSDLRYEGHAQNLDNLNKTVF